MTERGKCAEVQSMMSENIGRTDNTIALPVIAIYENAHFQVFRQSTAIYRCTFASYRRRRDWNLRLIDRQGNEFIVEDTRLARQPYLRILMAVFIGKYLDIELTLRPGARGLDSGACIRKILDVIDENSVTWDAGGNVDQIRAAISAASSIPDLIETVDTIMGKTYT